jgi:hypothetical protein
MLVRRRIKVAVNGKLKLVIVGLAISVVLGAPAFLQAKEEGQIQAKEFRTHLIKMLNLQPEKVREFLKVEEKYDRVRQEALERINKSEEQLEQLLSNPKPDMGKLKELIAAITSDQDIFVNTYKLRRDEELAMFTPLQQGQYMLTTWKWQQQLIEKYGKKKSEQPQEKKPEQPEEKQKEKEKGK